MGQGGYATYGIRPAADIIKAYSLFGEGENENPAEIEESEID